MAFALVPSGSGSPLDSFSLPNAVSLVCSDDGNGGALLINGLGFTGAGLADLKTFFGSAFRSTPLLNAFRRILTASATVAERQLVPAIKVTIVPLDVGGVPIGVPGVDYTFTSNATTIAPGVELNGPGVAGYWRVDIELRHTITN